MRKLIEITFMSLDGVIDAPDLTDQAARYFSSDEEHDRYQMDHLAAADALLLGQRGSHGLRGEDERRSEVRRVDNPDQRGSLSERWSLRRALAADPAFRRGDGP